MASYSVTQNTSFLTAASIIQKIISFFYFILIARIIGVGNTGHYFFAISFTTIFTVVADFGLGSVLTREAAKHNQEANTNVVSVFWTKLAFGFVAYALVVAAANLLGYAILLKQLIYLSGITMFFDNLHSAFYSLFRARQNLIYESIGIIASQGITLIIGSIALVGGWPLWWLIVAYSVPSGLNCLYSFLVARQVYHVRLFQGFNWVIVKRFIIMAIPFATTGILARLYSYSDSILMSKIVGVEQLGWWSVPYKITFAFQFIPAALAAAVYPAMSNLTISNPRMIGEVFERAWQYLFTVIFPLAVGLMAVGRPVIMHLSGPAFAPSIPILYILLFGLAFGYLSYITGALLNATGHQKYNTGLFALALTVNVASNLVFLPRLGVIGAAISAVIGNCILCGGGYILARRFIPINGARLRRSAFRVLWPAILMGFVAWWLSRAWHYAAAIPLATAVYVGLLWLSGGLTTSLIKELVSKFGFSKSSLYEDSHY